MKKKFALLPAAGTNASRPLMLVAADPLTRLITLLKLDVVVNTAASPLPTLKVSKLWNRFAPAALPSVCWMVYTFPEMGKVAPALPATVVLPALGVSAAGVRFQLESVLIVVCA
jgi:hypothetical protein